VFLTYALLTGAILSLWLGADPQAGFGRRHAWIALYLAACLAALAAGILQPIGLVWIGGLAAGLPAVFRPTASRPQRIAATLTSLALTAGLMTHLLPGFDNPEAIASQKITPDALPYRLFLNFDKASAGLLLLALCRPRLFQAGEFRVMFRRAAPVATGLIAVLLVAALAAGYVRFDPKFPPEAWLWLWANLCLTCMAEEALFRGFIQAQLQRAWQHRRGGAAWAVGVASVLFGLAHAGGGPTYVVLSTLAGVGYGWVFLRTGRIEASILTHFALNAIHFVGFTYPALAR
jgi:uncharacterized protein